ncbi:hypothetical protein KDA23_01435 [Candidatus Saccharibacteria bacterium]|nr:hypothetical protein [Candidatus Saccharibacteria bacterium]
MTDMHEEPQETGSNPFDPNLALSPEEMEGLSRAVADSKSGAPTDESDLLRQSPAYAEARAEWLHANRERTGVTPLEEVVPSPSNVAATLRADVIHYLGQESSGKTPFSKILLANMLRPQQGVAVAEVDAYARAWQSPAYAGFWTQVMQVMRGQRSTMPQSAFVKPSVPAITTEPSLSQAAVKTKIRTTY